MNMQISTMHPPLSESIATGIRLARRILDSLAPIADLALRLWVANAFFQSGLTKIQSFDSTIALFTYEYRVPLLSPVLAAYAGTFTELFFPVLLALGLAGRLNAFVLFVFNVVAVLSYPGLNEVGLEQHQVWGLMLLLIICHGPGKLSLDHLIARWLHRHGR